VKVTAGMAHRLDNEGWPCQGPPAPARTARSTLTPSGNSIYAIHPVTLAAGGIAHALFGIAEFANFSASTCNLLTAHRLRVFPPNQLSAANVSFTTQTCAST
jgi:hypothetical protein